MDTEKRPNIKKQTVLVRFFMRKFRAAIKGQGIDEVRLDISDEQLRKVCLVNTDEAVKNLNSFRRATKLFQGKNIPF